MGCILGDESHCDEAKANNLSYIREFVSEGHEGVSECFGINFAVHLKSFKGCKDNIIVIRATSHLGGKEGDHLGEVHGSINFVKHGLGFATTNVLAVSSKSCLKI